VKASWSGLKPVANGDPLRAVRAPSGPISKPERVAGRRLVAYRRLPSGLTATLFGASPAGNGEPAIVERAPSVPMSKAEKLVPL
jgi:hypothetical protein